MAVRTRAGVDHAFLRMDEPANKNFLGRKRIRGQESDLSKKTIKSLVLVIRLGGVFWNKIKL